LEPLFIQGQTGRLFAVYHPPASNGRQDDILIVPPFAEELNRCRHMMAAFARAMAAEGMGVLILDLYGTGDSEGRFEAASWDGWKADLETAAQWLDTKGRSLHGILAIRTGALLALDWLSTNNRSVADLALWGPVTGGAQFITQFLRLRVAEAMARSDGTKETTKDLKALIDQGETVEVGGYGLTRDICNGLEKAKAAALPPRGSDVRWYELCQSADDDLAPGPMRTIKSWQGDGIPVTPAVIEGPAFWTLQEPEHVPALIDATVSAFKEGRS
jgi:exosortase A-associated hydrolase 2